jgi:amidase
MTSRFRALLTTTALIAPLALASCNQAPPAPQAEAKAPFNVVEASISDMQKAMAEGRVTSRQLVEQYLIRIAMYDHRLHAAVSVNPNALAQADALDKERAAGKLRGPLHGIPVAVKDNIHTSTDMPTTGGSIAFKGYYPPYDATLVTNLKNAGAIIIAKSTLTELANWMAGPPSQMESGYNAMVGQSYNPYDPRMQADLEPEMNTGGSSSGIGVAVNMWAASVGTDTGGSVMSPTNQNMLAGIRATTGRISRWGIIPVSLDQDMSGPMAKTVTDVAIMLGAMESKQPDPNDSATTKCQPPPNNDYTQFLDANALKGARIGVSRAGIYTPLDLPGGAKRPGLRPDELQSMEDAITAIKAAGAEIVEGDFPTFLEKDPKKNFGLHNVCQSGVPGVNENCSIVFNYGMKRDFNTWVASLGPNAPFKNLTELREWNLAHTEWNTMRYKQSRLDSSDATDLVKDKARYDADRARGLEMSKAQGIDTLLVGQKVDAVLFPGASGAEFASRAGYPGLVVPYGLITNPPNGPDGKPTGQNDRPFGVSFVGSECGEPRVLAIGYAFEQATKKRVPPPQFP